MIYSILHASKPAHISANTLQNPGTVPQEWRFPTGSLNSNQSYIGSVPPPSPPETRPDFVARQKLNQSRKLTPTHTHTHTFASPSESATIESVTFHCIFEFNSRSNGSFFGHDDEHRVGCPKEFSNRTEQHSSITGHSLLELLLLGDVCPSR